MKITVLTLFPEIINEPLKHSIIAKALDKDIFKIEIINIRDFATDKHRTADDYPYGGGAGMVMKPDPIFKAFDYVKERNESFKTIFMTPQGNVLTQKKVKTLATQENIVILCGHYEGVDERVRQTLVDEEISIGDYVLTGGELPALVLIDAVARYLPGVLGNADSLVEESFSQNSLDYPQYTRPSEYRGMKVPEVLLSGHHQNIAKWRTEQAKIRTKSRRPDLLGFSNL
ncbi:tRNA (guanosine(37)-N1)-methyltransferase TrmD [Clostridium sp. 'deep sea']|uniref:tRNA (guanosine(37)-N1)-methyltransferase TrmD n=1 Tax=Clostridium sp. 'deep sea' TaxID=2779445 RepID=UPI0018965B62|nr:tRNA (guanosine(37)-N1)-methyltransferase TrmD [Clostridium sp. 'deep sea']QOR36068.1 tRNA (guanosine(37)-N1)-methyltransferase TrmD [Clostridium sp. 'deep sea']